MTKYRLTTGIVLAIQKQYHLINISQVNGNHDLFGNIHPYLIYIQYIVDNKVYVRKKLIPHAGLLHAGSCVIVKYDIKHPAQCLIRIH